MDRFNLTDILGPAALMEMPQIADRLPWHITQNLPEFLWAQVATLGPEFRIDAGIAVHASARVEPGAILKPPVIVGPNGFIASGTYLRGGVWLGAACVIGPGVEIKTSVLFSGGKNCAF
ncbi:LbetaH domain-containing protein [Elstera litoralis]|uniref:hypothetical protein n=1 Tax=Elstera litoralis TaxID=552518 RepID=UPI0018DC3154|nr:hypothetical protein [Elstera litoralis]